jgi:hypothetical protein
MDSAGEKRNRIYRDQLVTVGDLEQFKKEILDAINVLSGSNKHASTKKWLKTWEVRKMLGGISSGKLLTLRSNGTLPFTRIGSVIYYDQDDIQRMFEEGKLANMNN